MKKEIFVFLGITVVCLFTLPSARAGNRIIVDQSGNGDFISINEALKSVDSFSKDSRVIFIRNGIYSEKLLITKSNIVLVGESREGTIITQSIARDIWRCSHDTDWGVATVNINANDITLKHLTIQNLYGFENKSNRTISCNTGYLKHSNVVRADGHQMALRTSGGTRLKAVNVHFKAFGGDTVSPWNVSDGMYYFKDCTMEGGVDFYCPRGWAYAENCIFIAHTGEASLWHDGSANVDSKSVLKNCTFRGFDGFNLGRYHRDAQFFLINCKFENNMADKEIFLVPTKNIIKWGKRIYYHNCHRDGGDYDWFANNLSSANNAPAPDLINARWVFQDKWDPEKEDVSSLSYLFTNPSAFERNDELIVLKREVLEKDFGAIAQGKFISVETPTPVVVQFDDLDGDQNWDEAVFVLHFSAKEEIKAKISVTDRPAAIKAVVRSHAMLSKKQEDGTYGPPLDHEVMPFNAQPNDFSKQPVPLYQAEGPVWENDRVGFRLYFDTRNVKDIFGKVTSSMVLDTVGTHGDAFYHTFDPEWGMDILKVGNSLGAGGIAMNWHHDGKDSLLKPAASNTGKVEYELVANGPVRSVFRLHYSKWKIGDKDYDVTEEISIWAGQYFYESKITVHPEAPMVTGIVNLHSHNDVHFMSGKMAVIYSLDKQSENGDMLGMAIMAPQNLVDSFGKKSAGTDGVVSTYTLYFKNSEKPREFRFYAAWEKTDQRFKQENYLKDFLTKEAEKYSEPVKIDLLK